MVLRLLLEIRPKLMSGNLQKSNLKLESENGDLDSNLNFNNIELDSKLNSKNKKTD